MDETAAQIESAIQALEAQRALLGDAVVDMAVAPLQGQARRPARARRRGAAAEDRDRAVPRRRRVDLAQPRLDPEDVHEIMDGRCERFSARGAAWRQGPAIRRRQPARSVRRRPAPTKTMPSVRFAPGCDLLAEAGACRTLRAPTGKTASTCVSASTPARCCSAAASTTKAHPRLHRQHRRAPRADRAAGRAAHQPGDLASRARRVRCRGAAAAAGQGQDEPVRSYLVQRAKPRAFRMPPRHRRRRDADGRRAMPNWRSCWRRSRRRAGRAACKR